jgi:hypothetical protein
MKFTRDQKAEAVAYWIAQRAKYTARLDALEAGRIDDALPLSARSRFWQTIDAQTLREMIDVTDAQIDTLRKVRPID